jgi:hypothetical protein
MPRILMLIDFLATKMNGYLGSFGDELTLTRMKELGASESSINLMKQIAKNKNGF